MEAARTSRSNSRVVLYGLGGSAQEAMPLFEVWDQCDVPGAAGSGPAANETGAGYAYAGAARIPGGTRASRYDRGDCGGATTGIDFCAS